MMSSIARTRRAAPVPGGFPTGSMMRHQVDGFDEGKYNQQEKKATQEEQDAEDEKARKQAMKNLINSWQERLQLISVITTFFATTEAAMLVNTKPGVGDDVNVFLKISNAGFLGSLVLHVYASVLSFLGAFLLTSYKLREAKREEMIVEGIKMVKSPHGKSAINDVEQGAVDLGLPRAHTNDDAQPMMHNSVNNSSATSVRGRSNRSRESSLYPLEPPVFAANPHIEQVVPLHSNASASRVLRRIHGVCVFLTAAGFVLALIGILCYAWATQPTTVSIFTSACLGGALLSMSVLFV